MKQAGAASSTSCLVSWFRVFCRNESSKCWCEKTSFISVSSPPFLTSVEEKNQKLLSFRQNS